MGLQLRLHEVRAVDETGSGVGEWGDDDIYLGGVALELRGPEAKPVIHKMPYFKVGGLSDGDRKKYSPPRLFDNYGLGQGVFPKIIAASFVLVERDSGDQMNSYLDELETKVKEEAAVLQSIGLAVGQGEGGSSGFTEAAVAAAIALGKLTYKWYESSREDDIFEPQQVSLAMESEAHRWNGGETSPQQSINFRGHNAHYTLQYDWHLEFTPTGT